MSENILEKIINKKKIKIEKLKRVTKINTLLKTINKQDFYFDFKKKIQTNNSQNKISVIAEIKKASPSAGILVDDYDPVKIAKIYNSKNVTCLSVLTEEDFFLGNLSHILDIKKNINFLFYARIFLLINFKCLWLRVMEQMQFLLYLLEFLKKLLMKFMTKLYSII